MNHKGQYFRFHIDPPFESTCPAVVLIPSNFFIHCSKHTRYETNSKSFCALTFGIQKRTISFLETASYTAYIPFKRL